MNETELRLYSAEMILNNIYDNLQGDLDQLTRAQAIDLLKTIAILTRAFTELDA